MFLWCLPEDTRWNIPQCPRSHWNCRWYGHLQEINQGTWQTLPALPINSEKEQLETECFEITISTWESVILWTQLEFQRNSTGSQKIQDIQQMDFPPDKESMQSILRMVNFLNRYSPRLAELSTSLRQLCKLHTDYKPELEHYQSFNAIKKELSTKTALTYYDPASHTTLQTDSSKKVSESYLYKMELLSILPTEPSPYRIQLSEPWMWDIRNNMGCGKIPLFSIW